MINKKVGILTSGGDSPGMNQFIFTLKQLLDKNNIKNLFIKNGFKGILKWEIDNTENNIHGVNFNSLGGTIIGTSRLPELKKISMQKKIAGILKSKKITDLVILGGNGSYKGGHALYKNGINVFLVPGTVDNDIVSSDYSIGYDSSINCMTNIIERSIRSGISHKRFYIFEVMAGTSSVLTNQVALSTSADLVITLEEKLDNKKIAKKINEIMRKQGYGIMIVPDKFLKSKKDKDDWVNMIEKKCGFEIRYEVPGRVQRGAWPTSLERVNAAKFANKTFDLILESKKNRVLAMKKGEIISLPMSVALENNDKRILFYDDLKIFERIKKW